MSGSVDTSLFNHDSRGRMGQKIWVEYLHRNINIKYFNIIFSKTNLPEKIYSVVKQPQVGLIEVCSNYDSRCRSSSDGNQILH